MVLTATSSSAASVSSSSIFIWFSCDELVCGDIFDVIVRKGKRVSIGTVFESTHFTVHKMQQAMTLQLYITEEVNPEFIDEEECTYLGSVTITFPEPCPGDKSMLNSFSVILSLG